MPQISHMKMKAPVDVKRVPVDIQDGAALGYMNFASLDGARPATYYVNLKSTSLWPKYGCTGGFHSHVDKEFVIVQQDS